MSQQGRFFEPKATGNEREGSRIRALVGKKRSRPEDFRAKVAATLRAFAPKAGVWADPPPKGESRGGAHS
jgi:hypothetical protein